MTNKDIYKGLSSTSGLRAHSFMGIVPQSADVQSIKDYIYTALKHSYFIKLRQLTVRELNIEESNPILNLQWVVEVRHQGEITTVLLSFAKTSRIAINQMTVNKNIGTDTLRQALEQPYFLYCQQLYNDDPLASFLLQLQIMDCIVPKSLLVLDFSSSRIFSKDWIQVISQSNIPPAPQSTYLIQELEQVDEQGNKRYWLRTSGLYRSGCPELEIIDISKGKQEMIRLLQAVADLFTQQKFKEKEVIKVGYDGLDINLCWVRWENAVKEFPKDAFGGFQIRHQKGYNKYQDPAGVLFAVEEGLLTSPQLYISAIQSNPFFIALPKEITRQKSIATHWYSLFLQIYKEYQVKLSTGVFDKAPFRFFTDAENRLWQFKVKLGCRLSSNGTYTQDEFWINVTDAEMKQVSGVLVSQPYWTHELKKGDSLNSISTDFIVNWLIIDPNGHEYSPENIHLLEFEQTGIKMISF